MNKIRLGLALTACALAPLAITGCAGDDKKTETPVVEAVPSAVPAAEKLNKSLAELAVRIRVADDALGRVVANSATDPEERLLALDKAVRDIGKDTALGLGEEFRNRGAAIVAGWQADANALSDAELRKSASTTAEEIKANFYAVESALRKTDAALEYHAALMRDVRAALGARPNAMQIVAARVSYAKVDAAGKKVDGWLAYSARMANAAGRSPVPAALPVAAPATPDPVKAPAPAEAEKTATPAPAEAKPAAPAPEAVKPADAATPAEPQPKPSEPDPIPEPKK